MTTPPDLMLFVGRFHPLLVHLPVALILLLAALEVLSRFPKFKHANHSSGIILAITVPAAALAALCGWLLSFEGGYQGQLLQWHMWTGIATAGICLLAALLYRLDLRRPYRWCLGCGVIALIISAHFGGSLTHGSDYLVRHAPGPIRSWFVTAAATSNSNAAPQVAGPSQLPVFAAVVHPILQDKCVSCHGPEKAKGGLRLDSLEAMLKGGENGAGIVPAKPAESLVVKRMRLPITDDDHMPPDGKPQPSAAELDLIEWWVQAGAATTCSLDPALGSPAIPPGVARILQERTGLPIATPKSVPPQPLEQALPVALKLGEELNIPLSAIGSGEPWLQCNASLAGTNFVNDHLSKLAAVGANLRWLDLSGTGVDDAGLRVLEKMPNLARLHLERTPITDSALAHISGLANLEYLNLHHTAITDAGVETLRPMRNLRQLYLWETKVTPAVADSLAKSLTDEEQIEKWRQEIEQLQASIRHARVVVDTGAKATSAASTNDVPVNTACPVSGKPVDAGKSLVQDGKRVAFCCDECKAKFQQDPKPYLSKLQPLMPKETAADASK